MKTSSDCTLRSITLRTGVRSESEQEEGKEGGVGGWVWGQRERGSDNTTAVAADQ